MNCAQLRITARRVARTAANPDAAIFRALAEYRAAVRKHSTTARKRKALDLAHPELTDPRPAVQFEVVPTLGRRAQVSIRCIPDLEDWAKEKRCIISDATIVQAQSLLDALDRKAHDRARRKSGIEQAQHAESTAAWTTRRAAVRALRIKPATLAGVSAQARLALKLLSAAGPQPDIFKEGWKAYDKWENAKYVRYSEFVAPMLRALAKV